MSIKRTMLAAAATLALSAPAYAAQIGPVNEAMAGGSAPHKTLTLIMHGGGGGMHGGGFGGMHGGGFGGMHMGGVGPRFSPGGHFAFGGHRAFVPGGRGAFFHGRHGFVRHGRFFPFAVGLYGYGYGYGGSCYWNCRTQGFGPGYCSAYAYNFCY